MRITDWSIKPETDNKRSRGMRVFGKIISFIIFLAVVAVILFTAGLFVYALSCFNILPLPAQFDWVASIYDMLFNLIRAKVAG